MKKPGDFDRNFEKAKASGGGAIVLEPLAGKSLSGIALATIEVAKLNPETRIIMKFNGIDVAVNADDKAADVEKRYRKVSEEERAAFLASDEGKESLKRQEEMREEIKQRGVLLDELAAKSSFQFSDDMPSITGMSAKLEDSIRKQISVGAQWLADNPAKKPFEKGHESDRKKLEELMDKTDSLGHSGMSFSLLMGSLKDVAEKGFDGYQENVKQSRSKEGRS